MISFVHDFPDAPLPLAQTDALLGALLSLSALQVVEGDLSYG